jgi:hypothetical protein
MIHPDTELQFISREIGYGVVATKFIPKGTITWVLDKLDRSFNPEEIEALDAHYRDIIDTYCYRNNKGQYVLCWDIARYVNHSFKSNCLTTAYDFEIAIRDIEPGEQLTDDYGYLNIEEPFRGVNEGTKRKTVYPDDLLRYHSQWDKQIDSAMRKLHQTDQPLRKFMTDEKWSKALEIATGNRKSESILSCYYSGAENGKMHH